MAAARRTAIASALNAAEKQTGAARGASLTKLAAQVDADVSGAKDATRVRAMVGGDQGARGGVEVGIGRKVEKETPARTRGRFHMFHIADQASAAFTTIAVVIVRLPYE